MDYKEFIRSTEPDIQEITKEIFETSGNEEMIFAFNDKNQIVMFKAPDILYIEEGNKYFTVRTFDSMTTCVFPSYDIFEMLEKLEYFRFVNNGLMANMNQIRAYDTSNNTVYFNEEIKINAVGASIKYITNNVSQANFRNKQTKFLSKILPTMS
jgi:DNA-binding LytR/AlgR family response regulator